MQVQSGLGIEAQRQAIQSHAQSKDITILSWHSDDGVSGAVPFENRPGLLAAIRAVPREGILLVAKRDRLARDPMVVASCELALARKDARIVSAAGEGTDMDGPYGEFVRGLIDLVSKLERAMIAARTKAAKAVARSQGRFVGGRTRYGFKKVGGEVVPHPKEQAMIARLKELRGTGMPFSQIGDMLRREGMRPRNGKHWQETQLKRMVKDQTSQASPPCPG